MLFTPQSSGTFCFLPCSSMLMAFQIGYSIEYVQVHEEEIGGDIEQLVLVTASGEEPSGEGGEVEEQLKDKDDGVEGSCIHGHEGDVQRDEGEHGEGRDGPAEHTVGYELEDHLRIAEGVHQTA